MLRDLAKYGPLACCIALIAVWVGNHCEGGTVMLNHQYITNIVASHELSGIPPTVTLEPSDPLTHIGKRFTGEYVRQKVTVREINGDCTISYVTVPLWEREI